MKPPPFSWLVLLILTVVFVAGAVRLVQARGPLWLGLKGDSSKNLFSGLFLRGARSNNSGHRHSSHRQ